MQKIDRYFLKEQVKLFLIFNFASVFIFIVVNFFERLGYFIANKAKFIHIVRFYCYQIPFLFNLLAPFAFLIALFFIFQQFASRNEILIIKTSGCDLRKGLLKLLMLSLIVSFLVFLNGELLAFPGLKKSTMVRKIDIEKREQYFYYPTVSDFSFMSGDTLFYFARIDSRSSMGTGLVILVFEKGALKVRIDADTCLIMKNSYELRKVKMRFIGELRDTLIYREKDFLHGVVSPFEVLKRQTDVQEMNAKELANVIKTKKKIMLKYKEELVEFLYRFSFPLTIFVFAFFAIPIAAMIKVKSRTYALGIGLVLSFVFWILIQFFKVSGQAGKMASLVAIATPLAIPLLFGIFLWLKLKL